MKKTHLTTLQQLAQAASALQEQRTGHAPHSVTVILGDDMLVVTLRDALTLAEKALAQSPAGAAQVQEFHRQLFANSSELLRQEIKRLTGRDVREAAAEVEPSTGTVVHAFTTGAMVQVFQLTTGPPSEAAGESAVARWADDGGPKASLQTPTPVAAPPPP